MAQINTGRGSDRRGESEDTSLQGNLGRRLSVGDGSLIRQGAALAARVMLETNFLADNIDQSVSSRASILDTKALTKLEADARALADIMDTSQSEGQGLNNQQASEYARVNNELTKLSVVVLECCVQASSGKLQELQQFLIPGGQLSFKTAGTLAKLGELQRMAAEYFTPSGLDGCNLQMMRAFGAIR